MSYTPPSNYFNRFNPAKRYKRALFRAARGFQSAEANEIHDYLANELKQLADHLLTDGTVMRGMTFIQQSNPLQWKAAAGKFYGMGYIHDVPALTITLGASETVRIGIGILEEVITENEDATLRDPATNTRNFNEAGAARLRLTPRWGKESDMAVGENFFPLYTFTNGVLQNQVTITSVAGQDTIRDLIARYDAVNGSYVVSGLNAKYMRSNNTDLTHTYSVAQGTAHVDGYEIVLPATNELTAPQNRETRTVSNEPVNFTNDGYYPLRWAPIASVGEVNGIKEVTQTITHGAFTGVSDLLPLSPVTSILEVKQGATTYVAGTDFNQSGDSINWSPAGAEPAPGSSYTVKYRYSAVVAATIHSNMKSINVAGLASGTLFYVDYTHYIPRYDALVLNKKGQLQIVQGTAHYQKPVKPNVTTGLVLASIYSVVGLNPQVTQDSLKAFTMKDFQEMSNRINELQYNVATLSENDNLRATDPTSVKKGLFVDPFLDRDMVDLGWGQNHLIRRGLFQPLVNFETALARAGADLYYPYTKGSVLSQTFATKTRLINAYDVVANIPASVTITPTTYKWISSFILQSILTDVQRVEYWNFWAHGNDWVTQTYEGTTYSNETANVNISELLVSDVVEVPSFALRVQANKFNANELVDISFNGNVVSTGTANGSGYLDYTFNTPGTGILSGNILVTVTGRVSTVTGFTTLVATPTQQITTNNVVRTVTVRRSTPWGAYWGYDPLAQTFRLAKDTFLTGIKFAFATLPGTWVDVYLVKTQLGLPDMDQVLTRTRLNRADIVANAASPVWTEFNFENPTMVRANEEYAFVVASPDAQGSIFTAELGAYDANKKQWVTRNSYNLGVCLESANMSTWSPIPKEDLAFDLIGATFPGRTTNVIDLGTSAVTSATDLLLHADVYNESTTAVKFTATLLNRSNQAVTLSPGVMVPIDEYTGGVRLTAELTTKDDMETPLIGGDVYLTVGRVQFPCRYISRAIQITSVGATDAMVLLDIYDRPNATIKVFARNAADTAWIELVRDLSSAINLGEGWVAMTFKGLNAVAGATATRIMIDVDTTNKANRPACKSLRAYFT